MSQIRIAYTKPEILTLGSDDIVRLVGPVQGYGISGGNGADLSEQMLGSAGGTRNIQQP